MVNYERNSGTVKTYNEKFDFEYDFKLTHANDDKNSDEVSDLIFNDDKEAKVSDNVNVDFDFDNNSDRMGNSFQLGADYSINEHLIVNGEINFASEPNAQIRIIVPNISPNIGYT